MPSSREQAPDRATTVPSVPRINQEDASRRRIGLRIPQDLSVVGFDDLPVARWVSPPLTTVRQPLAEMGRAAAQMLGEIIEDRPLRSRRVELSTELIMRESTGLVPGTTR